MRERLRLHTRQPFSVKFDNNLHADTWTKYLLLDFSAVGMKLDQTAYLLFLFGIFMVARDRIELPTRGFSGPVKSITY